MKKLILPILFLVFSALSLKSQTYNVVICGQVTDSATGNPIPGAPVEIVFDSLMGGGMIFGYYNVVLTDANGNYCDTIAVPTIFPQGNFHVYLRMGTGYSFTGVFGNNPANSYFPNVDFVVGQGGGGGGGGPYTLGGLLLGQNMFPAVNFRAAEIYLIVYDSANGGTLTAIDTTHLSQGNYYEFQNVAAGAYLVKAALQPADSFYSSYLPTYHSSNLFWSGATTVGLNANNINVDIYMIQGVNPGGPGFVGGLVSQGANKTTGPGDPLEHVQIMILDMNDDPLAYTYTDASGEFTFSNLPYGTYKVWAEVTGKTTYPYIVTLDAQNPAVPGIHLVVNSAEVVTGMADVVQSELSTLKIYPHPVDGEATVEFEMEESGMAKMSIWSLEGKRMNEVVEFRRAGIQNLKLERDGLQAGLFLLKVEANGRSAVRKLSLR